MVVANIQAVETYEQKVSELRQSFFENPGGMTLGSSRLPSLIERLRILVAYEKERSKTVLGQALHFSSLFHCYQMDYGTSLRELNEMVEYAYELNDVDMQAAALIRQGMLFSYQLLPRQRRSVFHQAMQLLDKVQSPLIHMCVLYGYAESIAASGQVELDGVQRYVDAEHYFDMAESVAVLDDDPGHAYIRWNRVTQAIHRARFFVARSRCSDAVELLLAQISSLDITLDNIEALDATPDNIEVLALLAQAYCHMVLRRQGGDSFDRVCLFIQALVASAGRMESRLHHSQAQICYEFLMQSTWHREASQCLSHVVAF